MSSNVDANRVIQKLATSLANTLVQQAITQVELEDAHIVITKHGMNTPPTDAQFTDAPAQDR